jgi:DNA-binding MarR family transcriptional regulator
MARDQLAKITESVHRRIAAGLNKIGAAIRSRAWKESEPGRLTPLQGQTLALMRARDHQAMTITALAQALAVALATASELVQTLERKGLVRKLRSKTDARVITVRLTTKGRRWGRQTAAWTDFVADVVQQLPAAEQVLLIRALFKLLYGLEERGEIPPVLMCLTCRHFHPYSHPDPERPHHCTYFEASYGDRLLQIECFAYEQASKEQRNRNWIAFKRRTS